ncbi:trigger factor [Apibacter mensalis]|uniref:Trigger factor n=1 Tax=Apibacter mensalis TaxID=1586267 RepID=A0A0X3AQP6_9FLAO|nr:trigger factor [Apibacter mensalis]CVK16686.1 trigger factor [Apibacter mensalis]
MNVTQNKIDDLNTIVKITIKPEDYKPNVEKSLNDYRKKLNMPGFRKGKAPMSIVKKQYEGAVTFEEINKVLNDTLSNFISENKLSILGQPLPRTNNELDPNAQDMTFEFELGLAPDLSIDLSKAKIPYYKIEATDKEIDDTVLRMQTQLGEVTDADKIEEGGNFVGEVLEIDAEGNQVEEGINTTITFLVDDLKDKNSFLGRKKGDIVTIQAQDLFNDVHQLQHFFGLSHEDAHHYNANLKINVEKTSIRTKAELNQELFDKVYGKDKVKSEEELKAKIKDEIENYYKKESDTKFMNDSVEWLLDTIKFDLPTEFLKKFIKSKAKEPMSDEDAATEYEKSVKALRYQLIEGQILSDNKISVQYNDLVEYTKNQMKQQFAMYGYVDIPDAELDKYVANAMKNEEHVRQSSGNLIQQELLKIFDAKIQKKEKTVTLEKFDAILKKESEEMKTEK